MYVFYFSNISKLETFNLNILIEKKSYKNNLIYDISYKNLIDLEPLHIRFFKINEFIRICDGTRYLTLYGSKKYEAIYNRIRYLISQKRWHQIYFFPIFLKNQSWFLCSYDSLPIEKRLTLYNVIILIKSVLNNNKFF